jgi:hypothetical protein
MSSAGHGVACDAVLEAAAALPPGPSKPGRKGDGAPDMNVVRWKR